MKRARLIVGIICIALAIWIFLVGTTSGTIPPAIILTILGISLIATTRRE
ncbi:hypothetical protein ACFLVM_01620 [Chloroflexota bacterium]